MSTLASETKTVKRKKPVWKCQEATRDILEAVLYPHKFPTKRLTCLDGLEVDCYCEDLQIGNGKTLKLGAEYMGEHHADPTHFHNSHTPTAYEELHERDTRKFTKARINGIDIIYIHHVFDRKNLVALETFLFCELKLRGLIKDPVEFKRRLVSHRRNKDAILSMNLLQHTQVEKGPGIATMDWKASRGMSVSNSHDMPFYKSVDPILSAPLDQMLDRSHAFASSRVFYTRSDQKLLPTFNLLSLSNSKQVLTDLPASAERLEHFYNAWFNRIKQELCKCYGIVPKTETSTSRIPGKAYVDILIDYATVRKMTMKDVIHDLERIPDMKRSLCRFVEPAIPTTGCVLQLLPALTINDAYAFCGKSAQYQVNGKSYCGKHKEDHRIVDQKFKQCTNCTRVTIDIGMKMDMFNGLCQICREEYQWNQQQSGSSDL